MSNGDRKALHVYVDDWVHEHYHDAAGEAGVSVSALIHVISEDLAELLDEEAAAGAERVRKARLLDAERRRRPRAA